MMVTGGFFLLLHPQSEAGAVHLSLRTRDFSGSLPGSECTWSVQAELLASSPGVG